MTSVCGYPNNYDFAAAYGDTVAFLIHAHFLCTTMGANGNGRLYTKARFYYDFLILEQERKVKMQGALEGYW